MKKTVLGCALFVGIFSMVGSAVADAPGGTVTPPTPVTSSSTVAPGGPTSPTGRVVTPSPSGPATLGSLTDDLVYTPLDPCRIVDTRLTGAGAIASGSTRSFVAINASNFTSQGGAATNCGTLGLSATAVAVNFTVVSPIGQGFLTVYPFGTTRPLAANMVFVANNLLSNSAITKIPNPLSSFDFTIYASAQTHVVADIVGYFAPPVATSLQCTETANTVNANIPSGGTSNTTAPACPSGYTQTATNCETTSWLMPLVFIKDGTCSVRNNDSSPQDLRASRTCCRVRGR